MHSALTDVKQSQLSVLEQVEELQNTLGLLSFTSRCVTSTLPCLGTGCFILSRCHGTPLPVPDIAAGCLLDAHTSVMAVRSLVMPREAEVGHLMVRGRCSSQAQAVETARAKAEHTCRLALMVVHRADSMLTVVSHHNDLAMAAAPTRGSSEAAEDDAKWEEDSVFPGVLSACTTCIDRRQQA